MHSRASIISAFLAAIAALPGVCFGGLNLSFELETLQGDGVRRTAAITDWTLAPDPGAGLIRSPLAYDGSQYAILFGPGANSTTTQSLSQAAGFSNGQHVGISFQTRGGSQNDWLGDDPEGYSGNWLVTSSGLGSSWTGNSSNLTLQVRVNGSPIGQVVNPSTSGWLQHSFSFTATGNDTVTFINLGDAGTSAGFTVLSLDNVAMTAIPEPGSAALLAVGSVLCCTRRRRISS